MFAGYPYEEDWSDDWDDEDDESAADYDFETENGICSPSACGECWGGDGICMREIEEQARQDEEYARLYVSENVACPVCGAVLIEYKIPTDALWCWPGDFYNPMIPLGIFAVYDAPKGVVCRKDNVHHIWVGDGKFRTEKLINILGNGNYIRDDWPALPVTDASELGEVSPDEIPF